MVMECDAEILSTKMMVLPHLEPWTSFCYPKKHE